MATHMLTDLVFFINQQLELQEALSEHLSKLEALAELALGKDFLENQEVKQQYHYLWALADIIQNAKKVSEQSMEILVKSIRTYH